MLLCYAFLKVMTAAAFKVGTATENQMLKQKDPHAVSQIK